MLTIRAAIEFDIMQLLSLGYEYADEAERWGDLTYNPEKAVKCAAYAIDDPNQQIFVASDNGHIVGFMWVSITGQVWTDDPVAKDLFVFVSPEYRDKGLGSRLVVEFEKWAIACGAKAIHIGANSGVGNDDGAVQLYRSLGYFSGGFNYFKPLNKEVNNG